MADYSKYDPRVDSLVMEKRTLWDASVDTFSDDEKRSLSRIVHNEPAKATKIEYWRTHTGFIRQITVTNDDVARIRGDQPQRPV